MSKEGRRYPDQSALEGRLFTNTGLDTIGSASEVNDPAGVCSPNIISLIPFVSCPVSSCPVSDAQVNYENEIQKKLLPYLQYCAFGSAVPRGLYVGRGTTHYIKSPIGQFGGCAEDCEYRYSMGCADENRHAEQHEYSGM